MKKALMIIVLASGLTSCASWNRIGDLTSMSNRNIDDSKKYSLIAREAQTISSGSTDAMEKAIDNLTKKHEGEFLRNVKVYVKDNGKQVKLIGDVWGLQNTLINVTSEANANIVLSVGDSIVFKRKGKIIDGKIIGINSNLIIVEFGKNEKVELKYDEVTKTNK